MTEAVLCEMRAEYVASGPPKDVGVPNVARKNVDDVAVQNVVSLQDGKRLGGKLLVLGCRLVRPQIEYVRFRQVGNSDRVRLTGVATDYGPLDSDISGGRLSSVLYRHPNYRVLPGLNADAVDLVDAQIGPELPLRRASGDLIGLPSLRERSVALNDVPEQSDNPQQRDRAHNELPDGEVYKRLPSPSGTDLGWKVFLRTFVLIAAAACFWGCVHRLACLTYISDPRRPHRNAKDHRENP